MKKFNANTQSSSFDYIVVSGKSRFAGRKLERFKHSNGKFNEAKSKLSIGVFNPSASMDGQSLAGTGALVFEGELLGR